MGIKVSITDLTVTFVSAAGTLACDFGTLSPEIREQCGLHGLKQKVGDAAALGAGSTDAEKMAAMTAVWEMLVAGDWTKRVPGAGGGEAITVRAMARETGASLAECRAAFEALDKKGQAAMRKDLAAVIAQIAAEDAAKAPVADEAKAKAASILAGLRRGAAAGEDALM